MKRLTSLLALLILAALPSSATARLDLGFNADYTRLVAENFGASARASLARFPIAWPSDGNAEAAYEGALAAGVTPIPTPYSWAFGPATQEEYATRMAEIAEAFPGAIIQLWNEPNIGYDGGDAYSGRAPRLPMPPQSAAAFATAAAQAIRRVAPQAQILGPAIAPVDGPDGPWLRYLRTTYRAIPRSLRVEVALNVYPRAQRKFAQIRRAISVARKYGRVHVTEFDLSAPWLRGPDTGPRATIRALRLMERLGARTVVLHDTVLGQAAHLRRATD